MVIGGANDQRAETPQFLLEQPGGAVAAQGPEAVAADQFSELAAVVGRRANNRTHLNKPHTQTSRCDLPGRFSAGKTGTDHQDL